MGGPTELDHAYGERVHILDNHFLNTVLARLSSSGTRHPEIVSLLRAAYQHLLVYALSAELPSAHAEIPTRMADQHPDAGVFRGPVLDPRTPIVVADVIRAGMVPAQTCFETLAAVLPDERLRLDHLTMSRIAGEDGRVERVDLSDSKIGGSVEDAYLIVPDPMGATGSTIQRAVEHYRAGYGEPERILALPLIATPEYMRAVSAIDKVVVYTGRLDRGLSAPDVLALRPGERWDEERGLDENDYIVPGAGGMGEVINNSWC